MYINRNYWGGKSEKTALEYAQKAVKFTQNTVEKIQHKDIYAKALKANDEYTLSFTVMIGYLCFVAAQQKNQNDNIKAGSVHGTVSLQ